MYCSTQQVKQPVTDFIIKQLPYELSNQAGLALIGGSPAQPCVSCKSSAVLRELQNKNDKLQRELNRKEKALTEAAALLVLQKKYQTLWEGEEK
jgi:hypothetical protein